MGERRKGERGRGVRRNEYQTDFEVANKMPSGLVFSELQFPLAA